jgi:hypothetical protein
LLCAGWKLNEDVATAILKQMEGLALSPGQRTGGNRGGNERMSEHSDALAVQPTDLSQYAGTYARPPIGEFIITEEEGKGLTVAANAQAGAWGMEQGYALEFYGEDVAFSVGPAAYHGQPVEFIRDSSGAVAWVRVNGRIARKA